MKTLNLISALLFSFSFAFANPISTTQTDCDAPANLTVTNQTDSSVSFDWDDCGCGENEYWVFYVKNGQASPESSTGSSDFTFSGLSSGTYKFHFYTVCGVANSIIIEEIIVL